MHTLSWQQFSGLFSDILSEPSQKTADSLLTKKFLKLKNKLRDNGIRVHWSFGLCYVLSECAYHMLGGKEQGWKPMFVRHMGCPHWFLQHENGDIFDASAEQFSAPVHYEAARGKGFMTKKPCKRSVLLIQRILKNVEFTIVNEPDLDKDINDLILKGQRNAPKILDKLGLLRDEKEDLKVKDWLDKYYDDALKEDRV